MCIEYTYTCRLSQSVPVTLSMISDVVNKDEIFFHCPWSFSDFLYVAAAAASTTTTATAIGAYYLLHAF